MNMSRPAVHPVEAPMPDGANNPLRVRMKNVQGMPGTPGGLALRLCQFAFAVVSLCIMASTSDFPSVTAFCERALLNRFLIELHKLDSDVLVGHNISGFDLDVLLHRSQVVSSAQSCLSLPKETPLLVPEQVQRSCLALQAGFYVIPSCVLVIY